MRRRDSQELTQEVCSSHREMSRVQEEVKSRQQSYSHRRTDCFSPSKWSLRCMRSWLKMIFFLALALLQKFYCVLQLLFLFKQFFVCV